MPIRFYSGNYLENLVCRLSEDIKNNTHSPFEGPTIIVQSQGMMKWISLELAKRNGICANVDFRFPKEFIYDCFHKVAGTLPEESLYEKEVLTWKIMDMLPGFLNNKEFTSLKSYLKGETGTLKQYQLSEKIASLYDQYLVFRPEWIFQWQNGKDPQPDEIHSKWQGILWRALVEKLGTGHPAQIKEAFKDAFESSTDIGDILPKNIYIFGISSLPVFYVEVLNFISNSDDVNVYMYHLNPSKEYWGDITKKFDSSLLASMGILGRDFSTVLLNNDIDQNMDGDLYTKDFTEKNILTRYHKDIFELKDPASALADPSSDYTKYIVQAGDKSVEIHSCHSPMREIEILYDKLLDIFNTTPEIRPSDIIVMAPDIETYAPYIEAVFGTSTGTQEQKIPYSIADRSIRRESQIIDTFLKILDLNTARLTAVEVMSILEVPAVLSRFGISEAEFESLQHWVRDTQIRWGKDKAVREQLDLYPTEANTWEAGFKRLFLGYAMPGNDEMIYKEILPYDNIEGMDAVSLGKFYQFAETMYSAVDALKGACSLEEWSFRLTEISEKFFKPEYLQQSEMNKLLLTVSELGRHQQITGYNKTTDISIPAYYLKSRLEGEVSTYGFLKKGITFCSLLPMRSIPFRTVCMIGMNHDKFPRESKSLGFDLMRKEHKAGDRSKRLDDRYLFLESLISAREKLYISYVGQSIKDNSTIPPSVLVSELIDYAQNYYTFPGENEMPEEDLENKAFSFMVTKHKLQAFNPEYFTEGSHLFSYSVSSCETAKNYIQPRQKYLPQAMQQTALKEQDIKEIKLNDLIWFFNNPSKHFLQNRLGIYLDDSEDVLETSEPFKLEALDTTIIGGNIVDKFIVKNLEEGKEFSREKFSSDQYMIMSAAGKLPHGNSGKVSFNKLFEDAADFADKVMKHIENKESATKEIDIEISGTELYGNIPSVYGDELIQFRYADIKPKDKLKLWISFLALNAASQTPVKAKLLCRKSSKFFVMEADPAELTKADEMKSLQEICRDILSELIEVYKRGYKAPVRFFPKTSSAYYDKIKECTKLNEIITGTDPELTEEEEEKLFKAINEAQKEWEGSWRKGGDFYSGEKNDPYFKLCFRDSNVLDREFKNESIRVFKKIDMYLKEVKNARK